MHVLLDSWLELLAVSQGSWLMKKISRRSIARAFAVLPIGWLSQTRAADSKVGKTSTDASRVRSFEFTQRYVSFQGWVVTKDELTELTEEQHAD